MEINEHITDIVKRSCAPRHRCGPRRRLRAERPSVPPPWSSVTACPASRATMAAPSARRSQGARLRDSNVPYSYGPRRPAGRAPETSRPAWATQRTSQAGCRLKRQPPSLSDLHLTLPLCQPSRCSWQAGGSLEPAAQSSRKRRSKEACGAQPRLSARASLRRNAAAGADAVLAALAAVRRRRCHCNHGYRQRAPASHA